MSVNGSEKESCSTEVIMRLPESKIKEAILHPEANIRERAVRYFNESFSRDASLMPLVIEAVERYGREGAYSLIGSSTNLPQTEETLSWIIDELKDERSDSYENYRYNLWRVLHQTDPVLLAPRKTELLEIFPAGQSFHEILEKRIEFLSWDEATCWQKLEEICEAGKDVDYANKVDWESADQILEALARIGGQSEQRIFSVLSVEITEFENNPMVWMEPLMVQLAGMLRLESAIPLLMQKFHIDADILLEKCQKALIRIGTDQVVMAIADAYDNAEEHLRLYATTVLENIHTDLAASVSLRFFGLEKTSHIKREMAHAALNHFNSEAIEPVRQYLLSKKIKGELCHLRDYLVETCTIMGERFPEVEKWRADEKREKEEHQRTLREIGDDPKALLAWSLGKLSELSSADEDEPEPEPKKSVLPLQRSVPTDSLLSFDTEAHHEKVGRNDPCPCGSGKKFKKCCLKKQ